MSIYIYILTYICKIAYIFINNINKKERLAASFRWSCISNINFFETDATTFNLNIQTEIKTYPKSHITIKLASKYLIYKKLNFSQ